MKLKGNILNEQFQLDSVSFQQPKFNICKFWVLVLNDYFNGRLELFRNDVAQIHWAWLVIIPYTELLFRKFGNKLEQLREILDLNIHTFAKMTQTN